MSDRTKIGRLEEVDPGIGEWDDDDPVGYAEIAYLLGVKHHTAHVWWQRGLLPPPEWIVNNMPAWRWSTIRAWAADTDRPLRAQRAS